MEKEARYRLKKVSRKDKKAEAENEVYIQELRVPTRSRRQTQSGDDGLYHEISPSPGHAYNLHKYETRTPDEYLSRTASGPRIVRKISEPVTGSSREEYGRPYRQNQPRHSSWVEYEEDEVQEEIVRDTERRPRKDVRQEAEQEQQHTVDREKVRKDKREESARGPEGEHHLEFDMHRRSRARRKAGNCAQTDTEAGRDSIASVQRASVNLRRLGADDPREYMELKYGVLVEPNEKSLEEIEREGDFEREIKKSSVRPATRHSSYAARRRQRDSEGRLHEMEMRMEMDAGRRMRTKLEPETQLFSDPSDLSSSDSDSSDDEQIQAMLKATSISDNVCIPDTPYEPQTEIFRRKRENDRERRSYSTRPTAAGASAAVADGRAAEEAEETARQRTQSLRDLERSIREREAFVAGQEESLLRRQAALEERERRAAAQERELDVRLRERHGSGREREGEGEGERGAEGASSRPRNLRSRAREYVDYEDIVDLEPPTGSSRSRFAKDAGAEDPWYGS